MRKKLIFLTIILAIFSVQAFSDAIKKVIVTSPIGNIRNEPGISGKIIKTARKGDTFEIIGKEGSWYKLVLAVDKKGDPEYGYIHSSISKLIVDNVKDALLTLETELFDVIILDWRLPLEKGTDTSDNAGSQIVELLLNNSSINHKTPLLVVTAHLNLVNESLLNQKVNYIDSIYKLKISSLHNTFNEFLNNNNNES